MLNKYAFKIFCSSSLFIGCANVISSISPSGHQISYIVERHLLSDFKIKNSLSVIPSEIKASFTIAGVCKLTLPMPLMEGQKVIIEGNHLHFNQQPVTVNLYLEATSEVDTYTLVRVYSGVASEVNYIIELEAISIETPDFIPVALVSDVAFWSTIGAKGLAISQTSYISDTASEDENHVVVDNFPDSVNIAVPEGEVIPVHDAKLDETIDVSLDPSSIISVHDNKLDDVLIVNIPAIQLIPYSIGE